MQARLADNQSTASLKITDVQGRAHELTIQIQRLTNERDGMLKKYNDLRRTVADIESRR